MGFIGINNVFDVSYNKTITHREYLNIKIKKYPTSKVLVIMKNPSTTCNNNFLPVGNYVISTYTEKARCHIDRTTGKVLRKLNKYYDEITIINLYSLYTPYSENINTYYYKGGANTAQLMLSNNNYIASILNNYSGDIICAWGGNKGIYKNKYDKQIAFVVSLFNNNSTLFEYDPSTKGFRNYNQTTNKYPLHGLKWD